jgi:hypothetical protein
MPLKRILPNNVDGKKPETPLQLQRDAATAPTQRANDRRQKTAISQVVSLRDQAATWNSGTQIIRPTNRTRIEHERCRDYRFGPQKSVPLQGFCVSGRQDLNLRPPGPQPGALPDCATPRGACVEAGDGNRTRPRSLEGFCAATTLRPQALGLSYRPKSKLEGDRRSGRDRSLGCSLHISPHSRRGPQCGLSPTLSIF